VTVGHDFIAPSELVMGCAFCEVITPFFAGHFLDGPLNRGQPSEIFYKIEHAQFDGNKSYTLLCGLRLFQITELEITDGGSQSDRAFVQCSGPISVG
jgi:hypothetical protein